MGPDVHPGNIEENITTEGIDLRSLPIGTRLQIGDANIGEVSQTGRERHTRRAIYYQAGYHVMPKNGSVITVIRGGDVRKGDMIRASD